MRGLVVGPEALAGELGLGRGGEEDEMGAAEQPVFVEAPVEGPLEALGGRARLK